MFFLVLLGLITIAVAVSQVVSFQRLYRYVEGELFRQPGTYTPRAAVILPCKGLDPGFQENVKQLLDQDYHRDRRPNFEVVFSVASREDPAYPVLRDLAASSGGVPVKLVVAGTDAQRAQKINNQLAALREVSDDAEVIVFVDSDMVARRDFLRYLVSHLADPAVGATTGYRFYVPVKGDAPSVIRSIWNRMTAWEMAHPKWAFAWGGAMAIRRAVFEKAGIAASWDRAADDDLSLTTAVKRLGLTVRFVPQCLVASHGDASLAEIWEWTNRQLILTKVYYPRLWLRAIAKAVVMAVWLLAVLAAAAGWAVTGDGHLALATAAGLLVLPVELCFLFRAQSLWQRVLTDRKQELDDCFWQFCLNIPLAHLALPWMTLWSLASNRIKWRGVTYELRSPTETIVVQPGYCSR
jgi:hypothetical protein